MKDTQNTKVQIYEHLQVLKNSMDIQSRRQARQAILELDQNVLLEVLDELVQSDEDGELTAYVAEIIVTSDSQDRAIYILPLLQSNKSHLRRHTCGLLANCGDDRTVDSLITVLLSDNSADVRVMAAFALGKIRNPRALPALQKAYDSDFATDFESVSVSREAERSILAIERK